MKKFNYCKNCIEESRKVPVALMCPVCDQKLPLMKHFDKQTCQNCRCEMQLFGNSLEVEVDGAVDEEQVEQLTGNVDELTAENGLLKHRAALLADAGAELFNENSELKAEIARWHTLAEGLKDLMDGKLK